MSAGSLDPTVFVHERALCESVDVGPRTRIWAFAHVMSGARVGADCNVCGHAFIESGAVLGDRVTVKNGVLIWSEVTVEDEVFLGPAMAFTNDPTPRAGFKKDPDTFVPTLVRRGASLGAHVTVVCGVTIGEAALVGAGAVVTKDVPARALLVGNPARRIAWVCDCGDRLSADLVCACGRCYVLVSETEGLAPREAG